jgi:predicted alpha/beta superfamily hydrolase
MKDLPLLNELEQKIRELVSSLERERERNTNSNKNVQESQKLSQIEEKVRNLINLVDQLENK